MKNSEELERARSRAGERPLALPVGSTYPTNVSLQRAATKSVANTSNPLIMTKSVDLVGLEGFYGSAQQVTCPNPQPCLRCGCCVSSWSLSHTDGEIVSKHGNVDLGFGSVFTVLELQKTLKHGNDME